MSKSKAFLFVAIFLIITPLQGIFAQKTNEYRPRKFIIKPDYDYNNKRFLVARIQQFFGLSYIDSAGAEILVNKDFLDEDNYTILVDNTERPYNNLPDYLKKEIDTYPMEGLENKEDLITWTSVFTYFWEKKIRPSEFLQPPKKDIKFKTTLENTRSFINPYFSLFGGDRVGLPISLSKGIGLSFGIGTPYSASLESNFFEANFHILGVYMGMFSGFGDIASFTKDNNYNTVIAKTGYQAGWVPPFAPFLEFQYQQIIDEMKEGEKKSYMDEASIITSNGELYSPKILTGNYFNVEFRYPLQMFESETGKFYMAYYQNEFHIGLKAYEMNMIKANKIDFRLDYQTFSQERRDQLNLDILINGGGIFEEFANNNFAFGPSFSFSKTKTNKLGLLKAYINLRLRISDYYSSGF